MMVGWWGILQPSVMRFVFLCPYLGLERLGLLGGRVAGGVGIGEFGLGSGVQVGLGYLHLELAHIAADKKPRGGQLAAGGRGLLFKVTFGRYWEVFTRRGDYTAGRSLGKYRLDDEPQQVSPVMRHKLLARSCRSSHHVNDAVEGSEPYFEGDLMLRIHRPRSALSRVLGGLIWLGMSNLSLSTCRCWRRYIDLDYPQSHGYRSDLLRWTVYHNARGWIRVPTLGLSTSSRCRKAALGLNFSTNCSSTAGSDPGFHRWNEKRGEVFVVEVAFEGGLRVGKSRSGWKFLVDGKRLGRKRS
ncbi:hypothetical protein FNV43_RR06082 [Rhamnella rubrinervis]|uniref:Uncharacterized protein n=1 Tax=Rhamnella rubrinervis TaxID=2594499 RepID=A0A8K0HDA2_9ROSA|nr:hypothetical protein FNV43_RR06082 [Rhamnella rubrinervis]